MKVETIKTLSGANVYSHGQVVIAHLNPEKSKGRESREVPGFNEHLLESLPGLREHFCDRKHASGFVERLDEGTHFNHVVEHAAIELLALAGFDLRDKKFVTATKRMIPKP